MHWNSKRWFEFDFYSIVHSITCLNDSRNRYEVRSPLFVSTFFHFIYSFRFVEWIKHWRKWKFNQAATDKCNWLLFGNSNWVRQLTRSTISTSNTRNRANLIPSCGSCFFYFCFFCFLFSSIFSVRVPWSMDLFHLKWKYNRFFMVISEIDFKSRFIFHSLFYQISFYCLFHIYVCVRDLWGFVVNNTN